MVKWRLVKNQKDYKVWENLKIGKRVAVYRNILIIDNLKSGKSRSSNKKTFIKAKAAAKSYMVRNK